MSNHQSRKKKSLYIFICILLPAIGVAAFLAAGLRDRTADSLPPADGKMAAELAQLSEGTYDSVLLSMHSSRYFTEEDFLTYLGQTAFVASRPLSDVEELSPYLDGALGTGGEISHVYLCLDPGLLWEAAGKDAKRWQSSLTDHLYSYIRKHPGVSFEVLLPYPQLDYWLSLSSEQLDALVTAYRTFADGLYAYPNAKIFFPGSQYWLMVNPDNYEDTLFDANELITQKLFLLSFCDAVYQITPENEDACWNAFRETIDREREAPTRYPDLSDWCLVFFGDSIFGNYSGSFSVPGYVSGLSRAVTYNCASGGSSASMGTEGFFDFPNVIDVFFTENRLILNDDRQILYPDEFEKDDVSSKELCFIINFGINDYISGAVIENPADPFDIGTFKGGLRHCITRLRERFPQARYVLVSPTRLGVVPQRQAAALTDYIRALEELSQEMDLYFIDNYHDFIITEDNLSDYLPDGCHPNEEGRLGMAVRIMDFMEDAVR